MIDNKQSTNQEKTTPLKEWQQQVECRKCHDVIYSKWSGEFTTCKCGAISVDQTPYYSRWIGEHSDFIIKEENKIINE